MKSNIFTLSNAYHKHCYIFPFMIFLFLLILDLIFYIWVINLFNYKHFIFCSFYSEAAHNVLNRISLSISLYILFIICSNLKCTCKYLLSTWLSVFHCRCCCCLFVVVWGCCDFLSLSNNRFLWWEDQWWVHQHSHNPWSVTTTIFVCYRFHVDIQVSLKLLLIFNI